MLGQVPGARLVRQLHAPEALHQDVGRFGYAPRHEVIETLRQGSELSLVSGSQPVLHGGAEGGCQVLRHDAPELARFLSLAIVGLPLG